MMKKKDVTNELQKLGKRIKELRLKKGYSSAEIFAYENGFSRSQWARYEQGEDLRFSSLIRVCKALNIQPSKLFEGLDF